MKAAVARRGPVRSEHFELKRVRRRADTSEAPELFMAVPKRLLKRAVDRNAVRRIAREYWRLEVGDSTRGIEVGANYLLRLKQRPARLYELTRPARKKLWHAELGALFSQLVA